MERKGVSDFTHNDYPTIGVEIELQIVDAERRIIGWISSCRHSPTLDETLGLCWLPADLASREQAAFTVYVDGRLETAQVHHGPFYDPEGARLRS